MSMDPMVGFNYSVDAGGMLTGFFTSVSGLGNSSEVTTELVMAADGKNQVVMKQPGRHEGGEISLKRGITSNMDAWTWRKMVEDGNYVGARTNGSIYMYDQTGAVIGQWDFTQAWPSKIDTDSLDTGGSGVISETITLVYESLTRVL